MTDEKITSNRYVRKFTAAMRGGEDKDVSYAVAEIVDKPTDAEDGGGENIRNEVLHQPTNRYYSEQNDARGERFRINAFDLHSTFLLGDRARESLSEDISKYGLKSPNLITPKRMRANVDVWQNSLLLLYSHTGADTVSDRNHTKPPVWQKDTQVVCETAAKHFLEKLDGIAVLKKLCRHARTTLKKIMECFKSPMKRTYRQFFCNKNPTAVMIALKTSGDNKISEPRHTWFNDLMCTTAALLIFEKWSKIAVFGPETVPNEKHEIKCSRHKYITTVRHPIEKCELRATENGVDSGATLYRKHMHKNAVVSIARTDVTIVPDSNHTPSLDSGERWRKVRISALSPPNLVELTSKMLQVNVTYLHAFAHREHCKLVWRCLFLLAGIINKLLNQDRTKRQLFDMPGLWMRKCK